MTTVINLTQSDVDEFAEYMKLHDTDANNINAPSLKYKSICAAASAWLEGQQRDRAAKVNKAKPVEAPAPKQRGPDSPPEGDSK